MTFLALSLREISYSRANFALGCLAVGVASATVVAACTSLKAYDLETTAILAKFSKTTDARDLIAAKRYRSRLKIERVESVLAPLLLVGGALLVGALAISNIRDRQRELATMTVIGVPAGATWGLLLARATALGLVGGAVGFVAGGTLSVAIGVIIAPDANLVSVAAAAFAPVRALFILALAPILSVAVSLKTFKSAIELDPAEALR